MKAQEFIDPWHGHEVRHLKKLLATLRNPSSTSGPQNQSQQRRIVFFVGDSSLDNKAWIASRARSSNGVNEAFINPELLKIDVAHNLNKIFQQETSKNNNNNNINQQQQIFSEFAAINCSVEATTLGERDRGKSLWPQDEFVRDNITSQDILIISIGGNDIALRPGCCTICSMCCLTCCSSQQAIEDGSACGYGRMKDLLRDDYIQYVRALISKTKPAMIIPAMIYYPDESSTAESWANWLLKTIKYDANPRKIQGMIDRVFVDCMVPMPELILRLEKEEKEKAAATKLKKKMLKEKSSSSMEEPVVANDDESPSPSSTTMIITPIEWSKALNGKHTMDYVARVEPSETGGHKMARLVASVILEKLG